MSFLRQWLRRDKKAGQAPAGHHHSNEPVPGWDAITARLDERYGTQTPMHWGTIVRYALGGPDPLDGISAYWSDGPPPHWHYVSYGLSELYFKESPNADLSGWGIELTFRLGADLDRAPAKEAAPLWPAGLLQHFARYIFDSKNELDHGHSFDLRGPITSESPTVIDACVLLTDSELGSIDTPHGKLTFIQVFGVTRDEYDALREWDSESFVDLVRATNPLLVTQVSRQSMLRDPGVAAQVEEGRRRGGSSMGGVVGSHASWSEDGDGLRLVVGATAVESLRILLSRRVALGQPGYVEGDGVRIFFALGDVLGWHPHGEAGLGIVLPPEALRAISTLPVAAGVYGWPEVPRLTIEVQQSILRDGAGEETGRVG